MAKTYEQYLKNQQEQEDRVLENSVSAALDQVDLLRDVRARVEAFVEYYETHVAEILPFITEQREKDTAMALKVAELAELDIQTVNPGDGKVRLFLDDIKVLLDQLPQKH